jgi:hypothetical protein
VTTNIQMFKPIKCPSCSKTDRWQIALAKIRVIMDCQECQYRLSLPFDIHELTEGMFRTMPLEYDEAKKVQN